MDPHANASKDPNEPDIPERVENTPPEDPPPNAQRPSGKFDKDVDIDVWNWTNH